MSSAAGPRALLEHAVKQWKSQLVDLGARNTLLYYRDLRQGTLDLATADRAVVASLFAGKTVAMSRLFGASALPAAAKRLRTIRGKAKENFEERGLRTLFVTWGMATWTSARGAATPSAPLLLAELTASPRGAASEDFELSVAEEWSVNPTLLLFLEGDHKVALRGDELDELAASAGFSAVADAVNAAAAGVPGWSVEPRAVVANFSYAKLPLVRDLDAALESGVLERNDLLAAIAGDSQALGRVRARHPQVDDAEPDAMALHDEFLVLDADASQSFVVNAAARGANLVVEGPPGTGKSQTIANLIATLTARGQRVLFVAEKRAAIDAVLERLRNVGLGDIVLDLHGGAGSRRALAQELAKALDAVGSTPRPDVSELHARLGRRRSEVRHHAAALHARREPWNVSLYDAQSAVLGTPPERRGEVRLSGPVLLGLGADVYRSSRVDLDRFVTLGGHRLQAGEGAWAPALGAATVPTAQHAQQALEAATRLLETTLPSSVRWVEYVVAHCGLRRPSTIVEWGQVLALLDAVQATLDRFDPAIFDPSAMGAMLPAAAAALAPGASPGLGGLFARWFDGGFRRARAQLASLVKSGTPTVAELHAEVAAAAHVQQTWSLLSTDGGPPRVPEQVPGARGDFERLVGELRTLSPLIAAAGGLEMRSHDEIRAHLQPLVADSSTLFKLPELHALRQRLVACGLTATLAEVATRRLDADRALEAFDHTWHLGIVTHISVTDPSIASFDGGSHQRAVDDYRSADRTHVETGAQRVRRAVAEHAVAARDRAPEESALVQKEARKKSRHIPVRELFHLAPRVLTTLKPCWAMSPLVVAQLLPVERCFDVVVFDEASQITPADAIGALLRADRAIVAGDTKQLPPTAFFASTTQQDDDPVEAGSELALTQDMESVLDVMGALLPAPIGTRTLGWHYRSRDERLIAFSNAQRSLYGWALTTFPGVTGGRCPQHVMVPQRTATDDADSSAAEVATVVGLILDHATRRPDQSLGVITMGIKHADRIAEAVRVARAGREDLNGFFERGPEGRANPEPVFIKNLERVQGDERDAILLSVGYGKSADGRMAYRFGPLNQEGGERRLNVAITRARQSMTVVSSFSATDMDPTKLRSEGAQMLARYLAYAESGGESLGHVARTKAPLNAFERDVQTQLTAAGIPVVPQFGASGYWIDFAAQHPSRRGQMVLAIECDGVTYHASPTARNRDRLRQDHLERLGWQFHRIWSTEWFRHREREVQRVKTAYAAAVRAADQSVAAPAAVAASRTPHPPPVAADPTPPPAPARAPRPPVLRGMPITAYSVEQLVLLARWIESDTLLRTEEQLMADLMDELAFGRKGKRIVAALEEAIAIARRGPKGRTS